MDRSEFERAVLDIMTEEYDSLLEEYKQVELSPEFNKKMKKIIKNRRRSHITLFSGIGRKIACAVAALVITMSTVTLMNADSVRTSRFALLPGNFNELTSMFLIDTEGYAEKIEEIYGITADMSNYRLDAEWYDETSRYTFYEGEDDWIHYTQYAGKEYNIGTNTENATFEYTTVNTNMALVKSVEFPEENIRYYDIYWDDGKYVFNVHIEPKNDSMTAENAKHKLLVLAELVKPIDVDMFDTAPDPYHAYYDFTADRDKLTMTGKYIYHSEENGRKYSMDIHYYYPMDNGDLNYISLEVCCKDNYAYEENINQNHTPERHININGRNAIMYYQDIMDYNNRSGNKEIVWRDERYVFIVTSALPEDKMIEMARSVQKSADK